MLLTVFFTVIVGLVEVGPNVCSVDYFDANGNLQNFHTQCDIIANVETDTI